MKNTKLKNKPTDTRNRSSVLTAKNAQARVQKKASASNARGRGRKKATDVDDENVDPTAPKPNRRSLRLNGTMPDVAGRVSETDSRPAATTKGKGRVNVNMTVAEPSRTTRTRLAISEDEAAQHEASADSDEIHDLRRQLQEEKEKNRLLSRAGTTQASQASKMIPRPKGSVGAAGFSLITAMKLDKSNPIDKTLYNDILASVRALAISAGIDLGRRYKDQSITKLSKLMHAARETEPYLAKFEDDWATGQILRQYINGKQKYENAKANGKVTVGRKRNKTSPSDDDIEQATSNSEGDNNGGGSEGGDKWLGLNYPDHEMDEWGV